MPQLVPFYFMDQIVFGTAIFLILLYIFSKYILPRIFALFFCRVVLITEF